MIRMMHIHFQKRYMKYIMNIHASRQWNKVFKYPYLFPIRDYMLWIRVLEVNELGFIGLSGYKCYGLGISIYIVDVYGATHVNSSLW